MSLSRPTSASRTALVLHRAMGRVDKVTLLEMSDPWLHRREKPVSLTVRID